MIDNVADLESPKAKKRAVAFFAIWVAVGVVLLAAAYLALIDQALSSASQTAQNTVAFARESIQRNEANIYSSQTRSETAVWEKLEELDSRFDVSAASDETAIREYLDKMNLRAVFLMDSNGQIVRQVGDADAVSAVTAALEDGDSYTDLVQYPSKNYLARTAQGDSAYDFAACSTQRLSGGVLVGVSHVEKGDLNSSQALFNAMFDNYVLGKDGSVAIADEDCVLASNVSSLWDMPRNSFSSLLSLDAGEGSHGLSRGSFDGADCYGLKTTSNGYDVYVWFPAQSVMSQRDMMLAGGFGLYLVLALVVFVVRTNAQNAKLRREHEYAESLQRANLAKTDFLRRMSHDVRTPINGIRGMLAIGDHYADDMQKQAECRSKMWEASSFLLELVNSALDMNKLESGQMHFEMKPFDLRKAVQSVVDVLQVQAENAGISLSSSVEVEHSCVVGSSLHVKQVLQNLGSNALKYNRAGGSARLDCQEVSYGDGRVRVRFVCQDTGIGMSEEFQERAFEAFAQEDSSSHAVYRGTGLGLAISKEIVDQLGGTIQLESVKGQGTTFTIELEFEVDANAGACADSPAEAGVSLQGKRALLAEDNQLNAEIATFMLQQEGIQVETVSNGQEAVDSFKRSPVGYYDMILMDQMMPVLSGTEATRAIRLMDRPDAKTMPIIAVTANAFSDDQERSADAGMTAHVSKPLDATQLIKVIRQNCH